MCSAIYGGIRSFAAEFRRLNSSLESNPRAAKAKYNDSTITILLPDAHPIFHSHLH